MVAETNSSSDANGTPAELDRTGGSGKSLRACWKFIFSGTPESKVGQPRNTWRNTQFGSFKHALCEAGEGQAQQSNAEYRCRLGKRVNLRGGILHMFKESVNENNAQHSAVAIN